ncbi:protein of unknown function [Rhodovastum atsumiense]|nr:protein of unknown function [Rhodovastum atsumiense]
MNHCRSRSVSDTAAIGRSNNRAAMRVMRSNASLGGVSSRSSCRNASSRASSFASCIEPPLLPLIEEIRFLGKTNRHRKYLPNPKSAMIEESFNNHCDYLCNDCLV